MAAGLPAAAEVECGERTNGVAELRTRHGEEQFAIGLGANGEVIEIFTSKTGSFTIISSRPDGVSCLVIYGDGWDQAPARVAGGES